LSGETRVTALVFGKVKSWVVVLTIQHLEQSTESKEINWIFFFFSTWDESKTDKLSTFNAALDLESRINNIRTD
jgi:hypothetical protein